MFEKLRQNLNDLIRTDRPESPTDLIFITGSLMVMGLMIYATQTGKTVPGFEAYLLALGTYKGVKVFADKAAAKSDLKAKEADCANTTGAQG